MSPDPAIDALIAAEAELERERKTVAELRAEVRRLQLAALRHMAATASLHSSPHDIVAIRSYTASRDKMRALIGSDAC